MKDEESRKKVFKELKKHIMWIGDQIAADNQKTYYKSVRVGDEEIQLNDYVLVEPRNPAIPLNVAKVIYMWENKNGAKTISLQIGFIEEMILFLEKHQIL